MTTTKTTAVKTSFKKWICFLSNLIASIWSPSLCQIQASFPGVEFLRVLSRFKKRKENSSLYVHVLHKTSHLEVARRSRAVTVKEMYWKAWCSCTAVVLLIKSIVFWSCRCGRRRSCLSSLLPNFTGFIHIVNIQRRISIKAMFYETTTIFSATQSCNVSTVLQPCGTKSQQCCNAVLR